MQEKQNIEALLEIGIFDQEIIQLLSDHPEREEQQLIRLRSIDPNILLQQLAASNSTNLAMEVEDLLLSDRLWSEMEEEEKNQLKHFFQRQVNNTITYIYINR